MNELRSRTRLWYIQRGAALSSFVALQTDQHLAEFSNQVLHVVRRVAQLPQCGFEDARSLDYCCLLGATVTDVTVR